MWSGGPVITGAGRVVAADPVMTMLRTALHGPVTRPTIVLSKSRTASTRQKYVPGLRPVTTADSGITELVAEAAVNPVRTGALNVEVELTAQLSATIGVVPVLAAQEI